MSTSKDWATREVEIACKKENPDRKEGEWDYGCSCYESALKAYRSLCGDNHSGFSFGLTRNILIRLMNHLPLTPITDEDFFIEGNTPGYEWDLDKGIKSSIQCSRMFSLFRIEKIDGTVVYKDVDRAFCFDKNNPENTYSFSFFFNILNELFPIKMPYYPSTQKYELECSDALSDPKNGDFDTIALWSIRTPSGEKIEINRFWKENDGNWEEIDINEWNKISKECTNL